MILAGDFFFGPSSPVPATDAQDYDKGNSARSSALLKQAAART